MKATLTSDLKTHKRHLGHKNLILLSNLVKKNPKHINKAKLSSKSGVYAFWWIGDNKKFIKTITNCDYKLKGKKTLNNLIQIDFTEDWIKKSTNDNKICLYIGKSTNISKRISNHFKLQTNNIWGELDRSSGLKPNRDSQLRTGLEKIFKNKTLHEMLDNIAITWVELDTYENAVDRFYLEKLSIGTYFPLLNTDIER